MYLYTHTSLSQSPAIAWEGHCDAKFKCHICNLDDRKCTSGKGIPQRCTNGKVCAFVNTHTSSVCHCVVVATASVCCISHTS